MCACEKIKTNLLAIRYLLAVDILSVFFTGFPHADGQSNIITLI